MPGPRKKPRAFTAVDRARARRNRQKLLTNELDLNRLAEERLTEYADMLEHGRAGKTYPPKAA